MELDAQRRRWTDFFACYAFNPRGEGKGKGKGEAGRPASEHAGRARCIRLALLFIFLHCAYAQARQGHVPQARHGEGKCKARQDGMWDKGFIMVVSSIK